MARTMSSTQICRQCQRALTSKSTPVPFVIRPFSSTTARRKHGALPNLTLSPTADPTLRNHLDTISSQIFLPAHLKLPQKRLIYKRKHWELLRSERINVDIGDESHQLQPIERTKDVPDSWKSLLRAIELLGTDGGSWSGTFVGLMEGFKDAGRRWKGWQMEKLVRSASEAGMVGLVVDAATVGDRTGMRLRDVRVVREVLWGCRTLMDKAQEAGEKGNTGRALKMAERVAQLCEEKQHAGDLRKGERDPRVQPDLMGVLLELATSSGKVEKDKVKTYAARLSTNLERTLGEGKDDVERQLDENGRKAAAADYELLRWVPALNGLRKSVDVLKDGMPRSEFAQNMIKELQKKVDALKEDVNSNGDPHIDRRRGLKWAQGSL